MMNSTKKQPVLTTPTDDGWQDLIRWTRQCVASHNTDVHINMTKAQEELGELCGAIFEEQPRQRQIDEIADIVICAITHGAFLDLQPHELAEAVHRKATKSVTVGQAGGKASYLAQQ